MFNINLGRFVCTLFFIAACGLVGPLAASAGSVPGQLSHLCNLDENPVKSSESKLVGIFDGDWAGKLSQTVIIYRVKSSGKVKTYYIHGTYEPWGINEANCSKHSGKIVADGSVELKRFGNGADVVYRLDDDGNTLHGTYTRNGTTTNGTFVRVY